MKILITGHDGYIGAVMSPLLERSGHTVVGVDSKYFDGCDFGSYEIAGDDRLVDIRELPGELFTGVDAVIHLAAISNDPLGNLNPEVTYDINHRASIRIAEQAKAAGVPRFLYSSSCSVYGAKSQEDILDESADFDPVTPYAKSKVMVEADLAAMADDSFHPTYLRNATVYGVSPKLRGDLVVNNLVGWALTTGAIHMKSDGTPWRPLVHVEDVCRAFHAVLDAPIERIHNEAFNVGRDDENYRIRDVAELVRDALPHCEITYAEGAGPDPRCYRASFSKIAQQLPEFDPQWTVPTGIDELIDAYRRIGLTKADLEGARYLRQGRIRELLDTGRLDDDLRWVETA